MKKTLLSLSLFVLCIGTQLQAQKTGRFNEDVEFNAEPRTLSCSVPTDYDASKDYALMIALHGLGDNSDNYSNALIGARKWNEVFENTIIICPDGGSDANKDFHAPAGDEAFIETAIQFAIDNYSIDENEILLQGFSLGGRSALKYGLDNPERFKGLVLSTPALQGIADLDNDPLVRVGEGFAYDQASQLPIYITIGGQDITYVGVIEQLEKVLIKNDAILQVDYINSMGHSLSSSTRSLPIGAFHKSNSAHAVDVDLAFIESAIQYCDGEATPTCVLRNVGSTEVTSIDLSYELNGTTDTYTWEGSLQAYQHAAITLPAIVAAQGVQSLRVSIAGVNTLENDDNADNDEVTADLWISTKGKTLPYTEDFAQNDSWKVEESGSLFTWYHDETIGNKGAGVLNAINNILVFTTLDYEEHVYTPALDLSSLELPSMAFDVSYNYLRYTAPYFTEETDFADTLIIYISTDCGETFTEIYKKGGADLATFDAPIVNPLEIEQGVFTPTDADWARVVVDLDDYKTATEAVIRFSYKSGMGGCIYIDNAQFDKALSAPEQIANKPALALYPNPATDRLTLRTDANGSHEVAIYDLTGKVVHRQTVQGTTTIDLAALPNGYYQVEVEQDGVYTRKALVVSK